MAESTVDGAGAIPDRLLHHCHIAPTNGNSHHLKNHIIALQDMAMAGSWPPLINRRGADA